MAGTPLPFASLVSAQPLTVSDLQAIATSSAAKYHLTKRQTKQMLATITCESGWDINAVGGMGEIGLVQIYPPAHKDITEEQMKDPYFSLDFIAKNFSVGNQKIWSCWRLLFS